MTENRNDPDARLPRPPAAPQSLRRDLAMVSPELARSAEAMPGTVTPGWSDADVAAVVGLIRASRAPAIAGLGTLSIEACRRAIALAEAMRGRLLPWPAPAARGRSHDLPSVTQTATLGHVFASQLIVWVGCTGGDGPIAQTIASHQLLGAFVPADLDTVQAIRRTLAADPKAEPIGQHQRVAAVLAADADERVVSQWHKLAAQVQQHIRMAVIRLPDLATEGNLRGAIEAITWQTGLACRTGGVDFADGSPRPCPDAQTLLDRGAIDLLIDTTPAGARLAGRVDRRVALTGAETGPESTEFHPVALAPLAVGMAARVMRFDGVILWAREERDAEVAPPDPAAGFLQALTDAIRRPA